MSRTKLATIPQPPDSLLGQTHAMRKWAELAPRLQGEQNLDLLAAYCASYHRWCDMEEYLSTPGPEMEDSDGNVSCRDRRLAPVFGKFGIVGFAPSPQLKISQAAAKEMIVLSKALDL